MKNKNIQKLVMAALFCALICVATAVLPIPLGNGGYANLGDTLIAVCAFFTGPLWGFLAAGVGSALADVFLGYTVYAPATFIIKGTMALVYILIFRRFAKTKACIPMALLSSVIAEAVMVGGYFAFECILYTPAGAIPNVPGNLIQAAAGAAASTVLISLFSHNKYFIKNSSVNLGLVL
ncbi:MAG: ECF transporter S component [Ruminococcaceae bacterium]|nr:ECF transporter S component [Oscillospiraceae bacterium]